MNEDKLEEREKPAAPQPAEAESPNRRRRRRRGGVRQHPEQLPGNRGKHLANGDEGE
jgi:hypothetical protein